ncbi:MAG: hypothetical protein ACHQU0_01705 [Candidatus Paceibacteria bacterium]
MLFRPIIEFLGSQLFGNLILLVTVIVAFSLGYRQIYLSDVVELYAITSSKQVLNVDTGVTSTPSVIIAIQNIGTRLVYLDRYIFNGSEHQTNGQILPPTYSQSNGAYLIDLPNNGTHHVSTVVYYHDLDNRHWKSEIISDFVDNAWRTSSLPRTEE